MGDELGHDTPLSPAEREHVLGLDVAVGDAGTAAPAPSAGAGGRAPDTIDAPLTYGGRFARFDGMSARQCARRNPGLAQWCAENRGDHVGRLCAEALAIALRVDP